MSRKDRIYLAVPSHNGQISSQTAQTLLSGYKHLHRPVTETPYTWPNLDIGLQATSLLARNFNGIFAHGWNHNFDFVIILHADIGVRAPASGVSWIDYLVGLTDKTGAAAISAVVPIKSPVGVTSTGLDLYRGNPYSLRRLTIKECNLHLPNPLLITKTDVCRLWNLTPESTGSLLINTGVLCMNLKHYNWAAARWPGFGIEDCIGWSPTGKAEIFTQPEDWRFSRWLDSMNWPYYATLGLAIDHFGPQSYSNYGDWGFLHDNTPVQPSLEEYEGRLT